MYIQDKRSLYMSGKRRNIYDPTVFLKPPLTIFDVSSQSYYLGPVNLGECELRLMMAAPPTVDGGGFMQLKVSTCPSTKPV